MATRVLTIDQMRAETTKMDDAFQAIKKTVLIHGQSSYRPTKSNDSTVI